MVPFESLGTVSYLPSIVTMAVSVAVCEIFSVKAWRDSRHALTLNISRRVTLKTRLGVVQGH